MYIPEHFKIEDRDEIFSFIEANSFCQLISNVENRLFSTHLPFYLSDDKTKIILHMTKQNPQHKELENQKALITIEGPHGYISPSWYNTFGVPTWNYQAVHLYGKCKLIESNDNLTEIVETLTTINEARFATPWIPDFPAPMLAGIVGIEFAIEEVQCKYKISQNRPLEDRVRVVEKLESMGATALADAMKKNVL